MPRSSVPTSQVEPADSDCSICVFVAMHFFTSPNSDFISARSEMITLFAAHFKIHTQTHIIPAIHSTELDIKLMDC